MDGNIKCQVEAFQRPCSFFFSLSPIEFNASLLEEEKKKFILNFPRPSREIDVKSIYKMIFILILLLLALSPSSRVNKREIPLLKVRFQK